MIINPKKNKLLFVFIICMGMVALFEGCNTSPIAETQIKIDNISNKWVPDKREGICEVIARIGKDNSIIVQGETTVPEAKEEIINTLSKQGNNIIDSILYLPDTLHNKKYMGLVTISVTNLRKISDHQSELVSQAILGTPVMVLKSINSWLLIQTPDNYIAWTERSSITMMTSGEMNDWRQSDRLIYLDNTGSIYSSTGKSGLVSDLVAGSIIVKTVESGKYVKVKMPDGREGFADKGKLMDFKLWQKQVNCTEENVCSIASTYMGLPYLWGANSSKTVDCSGFVKSVYFMNGMIIARDASLQALYGEDIDISKGFNQLKKGDLLFFGSNKNTSLHVTHVAIYKGDGDYFHASGRVKINSLDPEKDNYSGRRVNSLLIAKKYIGAKSDQGVVHVSKHPWY
jgi:gamma-D-glutamyl-L-lysine dipeptidyl-peptidase